MDDLLTIGRFSRETGLTVKALRLYDRRGLLSPAAVDMHSGYRYYSRDQIERARLIMLLRGAGMPLAEIAAVLSAPGSDSSRWMRLHRERLEGNIRHSKDALRLLDRLAERLKEDGMETKSKEYRCSFCGKGKDEVERMIAGPHAVYICSECVDLCNRILDKERGTAPARG